MSNAWPTLAGLAMWGLNRFKPVAVGLEYRDALTAVRSHLASPFLAPTLDIPADLLPILNEPPTWQQAGQIRVPTCSGESPPAL